MCFSRGYGPRPALSPPASHNAGVIAAPPNVWDVQPGGRFLALMGAPVPQAGQSGMPVGVQVAQAPRPPQYGCARSSAEENVIHTPTPGGLLPPSRVCGEGIDCRQSRRSLRAALAQRWCRWESRASFSFSTNQSFIIRSRVQVCARCAGERKPLARASLRMAVFGVLLLALRSRSSLALVCAGPRCHAFAGRRGRARVQRRGTACRVLCRSLCDVVQCGAAVACVVPAVHEHDR